MKYIKLETKQVLSLQEIRKENPHMSIPEGADLFEFGFDVLHTDPRPEYNAAEVVSEGPVEEREGKFYATYITSPAPEAPVYVPHSVSMGQARLALFDLGKLDSVVTVINALPTDQKARALIEWEYRTSVERQSALVLQLGKALDLDLDALFIAADKL